MLPPWYYLKCAYILYFLFRSILCLGLLIGSLYNFLQRLLPCILFVLGTVSLIKPIQVRQETLAVDGIILLFVTLLFLVFATRKQDIYRKEGFILLGIYIAYFIFIFLRM